MNHKFAVFYVSVISVALVGSLYASSLNAWKRVVFTFPPEVQKVVANGTAVIEVEWRWLNETLEMIVKVNDDDNRAIDILGILFDSDGNGVLTTTYSAFDHWPENDPISDNGVFGALSEFVVLSECYIYTNASLLHSEHNNAVEPRRYSGSDIDIDIVFVANITNSCYCTYKEGEGYTFNMSIPRKFIKVEPPTPIHISFQDWDAIWSDYNNITDHQSLIFYRNEMYKDILAADFAG